MLVTQHICVYNNIHVQKQQHLFYIFLRADKESDTESTDDERTWGGLGKYEYSQKGLPHALVHARELVERGGHHGAYCTNACEAGHKKYIKLASKTSRTFADHNKTQNHMLEHVLRRRLWSAVIDLNEKRSNPLTASDEPASSSSDSSFPPPANESIIDLDRNKIHYDGIPLLPLDYADDWSTQKFTHGQTQHVWGGTIISNKVLLTRDEILTLLRTKLEMPATLFSNVRLASQLEWQCYGAYKMLISGDKYRKFVGISGSRRDFVRLRGQENGTVFSAQLIMFVRLTGFGHTSGVYIPDHLRHPPTNKTSLDLALVRWLSPHPNALIRDDKHRPICPPPFDINHALWQFSNVKTRRWQRGTQLNRQLHFFDAPNDEQRRLIVETHRYAFYDFILPQSIDGYMNCTSVDGDPNTFLETITLPFDCIY